MLLFAHRLALALHKTRAEILDMSADEFIDWFALTSFEPIGGQRDDLRMAIIAATQVNLWSKQKVKPSEFIPDFEPKPPKGPQTMEEQMAIFTMLSGG